VAVPSLLTNNFKIAIVYTLLVSESEDESQGLVWQEGGESPDADQSINASLALDLQYKSAHFSNSFHSVLTLATH
jgi:hypothetical protein